MIAEQPDLTLVETVPNCASDGSKPAAARFRGFSIGTTSPLKKSLQAAERQRADVAQARRRWMREQGMFDPARLLFIDETAVSTNLVRLNGRAPRGERVIGSVPLGTWETITFVAALRHNKMTAPMVLEGAMTGEMFLAYVVQCLVPTLKRNDIVVMDNCRVHLGPGIREAIEKAGASLRSAEILARSQSDRNALQQIQDIPAQGCSANCPRPQSSNSLVHPAAQSARMCQLFQACRLCFNMTGIRFSSSNHRRDVGGVATGRTRLLKQPNRARLPANP